jgi:tetratricopeptide (TPR) repeat protein
MFRKRKTKEVEPPEVPVPAELPPVEGLEEQEEQEARHRPRTWLWTLIAALIVVLLVVYVIVLGVMGIYHGLRDQALANRQFAQEHYTLGLTHLEANDYELAIAEFELALRHDSDLQEARSRLQQAKDMAKAQITPTSEARQDAATSLYNQAVAYYESGDLEQAVAVLEELHGLDADHQRENVTMMLTTSHYRLGLDAVQEDRLDEATEHFMAVLALKPDDEDAQDQLNLADLYTAALSYWDRDWAASIQALKGLYALAPEYKDVQTRLRDAYIFHAQSHAERGDWCQAADQYAAAVELLPLETTVDKRDDAAIRCQATAEAPTITPTSQAPPTSRPTAETTAFPQSTATATPTQTTSVAGEGQIAFTSYDTARQRYDIYVVDLSQGEARLLRENGRQPALAAGGQRLAFRNLDPLHLGLGVLEPGAQEVREVTAHLEDSVPAWSPDASQIVFASDKEGDRKWRIYAVSVGEVRGEGEQWAFGEMPAWSSAGNQIAYHGCDERGDQCGVWVMQPGGGSPARLTSDASDTAPAWSRDGALVAFISARSGNWELYLVDVATGQETRLTDHPADDLAPTWSPDGQRLGFLSNREGIWAVYILDIESGNTQKIIATGDGYPDPLSERLSWVR